MITYKHTGKSDRIADFFKLAKRYKLHFPSSKGSLFDLYANYLAFYESSEAWCKRHFSTFYKKNVCRVSMAFSSKGEPIGIAVIDNGCLNVFVNYKFRKLGIGRKLARLCLMGVGKKTCVRSIAWMPKQKRFFDSCNDPRLNVLSYY